LRFRRDRFESEGRLLHGYLSSSDETASDLRIEKLVRSVRVFSSTMQAKPSLVSARRHATEAIHMLTGESFTRERNG
jgi:hypothetical protein